MDEFFYTLSPFVYSGFPYSTYNILILCIYEQINAYCQSFIKLNCTSLLLKVLSLSSYVIFSYNPRPHKVDDVICEQPLKHTGLEAFTDMIGVDLEKVRQKEVGGVQNILCRIIFILLKVCTPEKNNSGY